MERIFDKGEWITSTVSRLTHDEHIRQLFQNILVRTIGEAADSLNFPYDRYSAPDGIGRPEKAQTVGQWLCMETRLNKTELDRREIKTLLHQGSLDEIWTHADARLRETGFTSKLPRLDGDEETVLEFQDGYSLVEIRRPEAVRNEYAASGINGGVGDGIQNLVLRDRDNASVAMLVIEDGVVLSMRGPSRQLVPFHVTEAYLLDLITERGYRLSEPTALHCAVQISDGRVFDVRDIPDGSHINGSLWLREEGRLISRLPDDLTVNGDFGIFDATYLRSTPRGMTVTGNAGFVNCLGLKTISQGLRVGGYTHLETCDNITTIELDVDFGSSVSLSSEIKTLNAEPFKAERVVVGNYEVDNIPRNMAGQVTVKADFISNAVGRRIRKEIAKLPGLAASILVDELKFRIRRGVRAVTKATSDKGGDNRDEPPRTPKL